MPLAPVPVHSAHFHAICVNSRGRLFAFDSLLSAALLWDLPAASPANTLSQHNLTNDIPRQDSGVAARITSQAKVFKRSLTHDTE